MSARTLATPGVVNSSVQVQNIIDTTYVQNIIDTTYVQNIVNTSYIQGIANSTYVKNIITNTHIGDKQGMQLIAYCSVNPNKGSVGEFSYRTSNRRGLRVDWTSSGFIKLSRDEADDTIGTSNWMPNNNNGYVVKVHWNMIESNAHNACIATSWSTGASPINGYSGYHTFRWYNINGTVATGTPTTNNNGMLHFEVWRCRP